MKPDLKLKAWYESQMAGGGIAKTAKAAGKASEKAVSMARDMAKKSKFKTLEPQVREQEGQYGVQRLERIFDEVPNIARQYEDQALLSALRGDNAQTLMIMNPQDFEKFASPLNIYGSEITKGSKPLDQYVRELGVIAREKGFEDVPFLELGKPQGSSYLNIPGHEGRHRMRALRDLGDEATLVRTLPRGSVREPLPRRSRQEYLEALSREHGNPLLVNPEDITSDIIDLRRALPEQFAEGGEVAPEVVGGGTGIPYAKGGGIAKKVANASTKAAKKLSKKDISTIASELERSTGILPKVTSDYPFIKDVSVAKMEEIGGGEPITAYRALALYEGSPIRRETTPSTSIDPVVPFNILTGTPIIIKGNKFLPPEAVVRTYKGIEPTSTEVYVPSMIEEIAQRQPEALEMPYRFKSGEKGTVKDVFDAVEKEKELIADVSNLTPSDQFYKSGDGFNQSTYLNVARGVLSGQWKGAENYLKYQNFTDKPAAIQHLDMFAESIKNQYGKKRGGAIDHDLKNWYAASGGAASYTQSQQAQAKKASDIQSYREGKVGADELLSYFPGMTAAMIEAQLNPQEEPRMAAGGNPELDPMMEALSPDRESSSDPRLEAAGVIGKSLIKSMASPFVGIYGTLKSGKYGTQEGIRAGEEAIEEFMHPGDISPEAMPYVQDVGKFLEELETKYKIPPLLPEAMPLAGVRGVKPQVQNIVSGVNERIKELPPLPVGLSTENVGPPLTEVVKPKKPEVVKAPANELGLYSPAEKAILNMQRKQGSGEAFLSELKKAGVSNDELEFTRLNDFLKGKKAVTRDEVQKYIQDHRLEMREVEYRQGDIDESEFNFGEGEVLENDSYISDRADDYIREFDDYFPGSRERVREEIMDGYAKEELEDPYILERIEEEVDEKIRELAYENAQEEYYQNPEYEWTNQAGYSIYGNDDMGYYLRDPDGRPVGRGDYRNFEHAEGAAREDAMLQGLLGEGDTRFADYQLDNGQNYRELLLVAPVELPAKLTQEEFNKMSSLYALENKSPEQVAEYKALRAKHRMANQPMEFTDSHWNEPDVLLHMRVQDRTTTDGKPMLYVDEMQSDWHQKGNEDGYMTTDQMAKAADLEDVMIEKRKIWEEKRNAYDEYNEQLTNQLKKEYFNTDIPLADLKKQDPKWEQLYREMTSAANDLDTARRAMKGVDAGVLDAPYKENWHELGVKRILAYAARNGYDRVGFSASPAQIKRWGTQEIAWEKIPKQEMSKENFFKWAQDKFATTPDEPLNAYWDNQGTLYQAFKQTVDDSGGWQVAATEQRGGIAGRINLEADARARGVLKTNRSDRITTQEELRRIVDSSTRGLSEAQIDRITKKTWDRMQKQDAGITAPREEGMRAFYDNKLKKFAEKYAKKMGGEFYEAETKTGRGVVEGGGYGDVTEPVYVIELTPKLKDSAIKGQAYKKGGLVTQPKGWKYKGSRPCKDFKAQKFARGGAVRMQAGGNPLDQIRQQLAAGVPVHMSPGPEGVMARELIEEENRAREEAAKAKAQRVSNLPFMDKVRGGIEAGRTLQSIVGQEIAKPFVGLIGGEKKIAELEEGTPLPESEAGVQYLTNVAEALAPVGQAIQAAKIPDVPFLPELVPVSYVPGVGKQVAGVAARAAKKVDEIVPEGLKNLPVGGSTVPAPGTPSAAQAISGKVKVPADELGFYSPAEKAAVNLQRKSGSGQAFLNDISKQGVKKDELESTGLAEWLKSKPTVTKDEVVDYIHNNKIQIKEVMRSKDLSESEILKMEELERLISKGYYDIPQEDLDWFEATKKRYMASPPPKFDSEDLNLPGGSNYRELLLTIPAQEPKKPFFARQSPDGTWDVLERGDSAPILIDLPDRQAAEAEISKMFGAGRLQSQSVYRSPHWEEPNVFAHIRMQDKDIDGKKTLVIEEIQSDWHQAGRDKGYGTEGGVPNAPFKEDWYQVALKRAMKYAADNDYDAVAIVGGKEQANRYALSRKVDAIGVEKTNGGRNINIQTKGGGTLDLVVDDNGTVVSSSQKHFDRAVGKPITDVVGKSMGKKLMEMDKGVVSGQGLDIGGEGMVKYYDEIYPRYLEKQYKKYGVKPNQKSVQTKYYNENDVEMVETGEADRFGREMMAYKVTDPESGDVVSYEYSFEDAINAANRDVPKTNIWVMDIPTSLKSDVKIGQSYKKGGLVKDKRLQEWHMAGGGISKVGKVAKAAEKASKRMSRAESEAAGLWHQISETKLAKPVGEYKATVVEDPSAQMLPKKTITPEELQGGVAIPLAGDRAAAGRIIQEIEGVPMNVALEGGPDFMRLHPGAAWASGKGVLSMLADRIKMARESGQPIYGVYTAMSPQAVDFNTMVTESLLNQLDISGLRKKDIKEFDAAVRQVKGQGNKPKAPNFPGLQDPELREKLMSGPGGQRDAFVKTMAKAGFQKKGFPDVAATRLAVTEPELLDIERGSAGYTIAKLDPEGRIVEQSGHTTYPLDILGEYAGGLENQLPVEIMYPTHFEAKRLMGSKPEGAHKSLELFAPLQYLNQNWLDNAMQYLEMQKKLTGRKKGGLAHAKV